MRPVKTRHPFTLYKKTTNYGLVWYVRFWNEAAGKYTVTRSTGIEVSGKKERRAEALEAARAILPSIRFTPPAPEKLFTQYLTDFWADGSPYIRECALVRKRPLSIYNTSK